jgi:hypothetical protein
MTETYGQFWKNGSTGRVYILDLEIHPFAEGERAIRMGKGVNCIYKCLSLSITIAIDPC